MLQDNSNWDGHIQYDVCDSTDYIGLADGRTAQGNGFVACYDVSRAARLSLEMLLHNKQQMLLPPALRHCCRVLLAGHGWAASECVANRREECILSLSLGLQARAARSDAPDAAEPVAQLGASPAQPFSWAGLETSVHSAGKRDGWKEGMKGTWPRGRSAW